MWTGWPNLEVTFGCSSEARQRFCPFQAVTRGQMATFLTRAFDLEPAAPRSGSPTLPATCTLGDINALAAADITAGCATASEPVLSR